MQYLGGKMTFTMGLPEDRFEQTFGKKCETCGKRRCPDHLQVNFTEAVDVPGFGDGKTYEGVTVKVDTVVEEGPKPVYTGDECPKCGEPVLSGYGLAGGGIGPYGYCSSEKCDYFSKKQDGEP